MFKMNTNAAIPHKRLPTPFPSERLRERIPEDVFVFRFSRSAGPGGQNVNKVNTRVTLLFDLTANEELTPAEKRRIAAALSGRISSEGILRVTSSRMRSQRANRETATERFYELLAKVLTPRRPRKATRIPYRSRRQRLENKRIHAETKRLRGPVGNPQETGTQRNKRGRS